MQQLIVALIVSVAAGYAAWYWMPRRWRTMLAARLGRRRPELAAALARNPGCGACESCGPCVTTPVKEVMVAPPEPRRRAPQSPTH